MPTRTKLSILDTEILEYLAKGETTLSLAKLINRKPSWVRDRLRMIYIILGVKNMTHAVATAIRRDLL